MVYLDNAATTYPKPHEVYDFADNIYRKSGVYQGRGNYSASRKINDLIHETRMLISSLFGAPKQYEVIFTPSATISINTILKGYSFKKGMNIYISNFEHNAVIRTLEAVKEKVDINIFKLNENSHSLIYDTKIINKQFIKNKPDMVIINHASNVIGLVAPIKEIFDISKSYGAINILDASQTAGILNINLKVTKVDCVVFSGHKSLYAPFGIAGIILNTNISLNPLIHGGTGQHSAQLQMPKKYPERLEAGSIDIYALAGLNASLKWIQKVGTDNIYLKEKQLLNYALICLKELKQVKCYIPKGEQIGILSFCVRGYSPDEISTILDKNNIAVRAGLHCAPNAHKLICTFPGGTVRIGIGYFNCKDDIDKLVKVITQL